MRALAASAEEIPKRLSDASLLLDWSPSLT